MNAAVVDKTPQPSKLKAVIQPDKTTVKKSPAPS